MSRGLLLHSRNTSSSQHSSVNVYESLRKCACPLAELETRDLVKTRPFHIHILLVRVRLNWNLVNEAGAIYTIHPSLQSFVPLLSRLYKAAPSISLVFCFDFSFSSRTVLLNTSKNGFLNNGKDLAAGTTTFSGQLSSQAQRPRPILQEHTSTRSSQKRRTRIRAIGLPLSIKAHWRR